LEKELSVTTSCLAEPDANNVLAYLKQIAFLSELKSDQGIRLLANQYKKIDFIGENTALSKYLNPKRAKLKKCKESTPIFPFGCNASQYKAVKAAMENSISVIQGPPGTGKT
jgi:hypothetical protein